jgi:tetratricopeptide (TPR) repeat protein
MANNQLGIIRWNLGKYDQAIGSFIESCRLAEDLSGANLNLGIALYHAGRLDQAEFELTKILNEEPGHATARLYLGLVLMQQEDWKSAAEELGAALKTDPNNAAGQNALALAELHQNQNSDVAVKRLKQLIAAAPDYAPAAYNLAMIHDQWLQNPEAALGWYKQYLQKAGEQGGQVEAARQAIDRLSQTGADASGKIPQEKPIRITAAQYIANGTKLHAAKKYREAVVQYEKAIAADSALLNAHYNLGLSHYELKQYGNAIEAFSNSLKLDPDFTNARYMLALSYARQGDWGEAEREAEALKKTGDERGESLLKYIAAERE